MPDASSPRYCQSLPGLNRLLEVTRLLAQEIDTAKVLDTITLEATKALHCDRAILYQFDEKRSVLFATSGTSEEVVVPLDRGIAGHVARQRMMANIADAPRHAMWDAAYDKIAGYQTQTVLAVPLVAARDGRLLGVLEMLNNVGGPFDSDDEALALAFSAHASAALDRARLVEALQQQRELEASLQVAREVQRRFMPSRLPTLAGYEVATWWYPNQAVGGDYCDVISLPSGESILTIADVSGHGLGPSLLMASVRAALRTLLLDQTSPQVLLERLALALADDFEQGSFVTMCLAKLAPESHTLTYSNAGHGPALVYRAATGQFEEASSTGLPLGVVVPADYPEGPPITLAPGDLFFLATDGIVESFDRRGQQFGVERLMQLITRLVKSPIQEMVRTIGREVQLHYVGDSPPDDLTILALRKERVAWVKVLGAGRGQDYACKPAQPHLEALWSEQWRTCYAGVLHRRFGGVSSGYAPTFEHVTEFPGRMERASQWALTGAKRRDKPWLNELPRLIFVSDVSDGLSETVAFSYLKREVIEVVQGELGKQAAGCG